jgi:hypothetical protein
VKVFFFIFVKSFDRARVADHGNLLFSLSKYFFLVEKHENLAENCYYQQTQLFQNVQSFVLRSFFFGFQEPKYWKLIENVIVYLSQSTINGPIIKEWNAYFLLKSGESFICFVKTMFKIRKKLNNSLA